MLLCLSELMSENFVDTVLLHPSRFNKQHELICPLHLPSGMSTATRKYNSGQHYDPRSETFNETVLLCRRPLLQAAQQRAPSAHSFRHVCSRRIIRPHAPRCRLRKAGLASPAKRTTLPTLAQRMLGWIRLLLSILSGVRLFMWKEWRVSREELVPLSLT